MKHKKGFKALAAAVLSVSLLIGLVPATVFAEDTTAVTYVDENGDEHTADCKPIPSTATLTDGWYVINSAPSGRVNVIGDVKLVVAGYVSFNGGFHVPSGSALTIYKAADASYAGLNISTPPANSAGIGGNNTEANGAITINSINDIVANGGANAPGIGAGKDAVSGQPGEITIRSFTSYIKAKGQGGTAGIVGSISIFDSAKITYKNENDNYVPAYNVSICNQESDIYITNCDHKADSRCETYTSTQHKVLCGDCRTVLGYEDHNFGDGDECSLCGAHKTVSTECTVTYVVNNVESSETVSIDSVLTKPADPEAEEGMRFVCWIDEETGNPFDFTSVITKNVTLIATFDYAVVATLKEKTVVFEGVLQIRYTMDISQELWEDEGAYISFIQEGKDEVKVPITEGVASNGDYYYYYPVPIPEYQDVVTVRVYNGEGNTVLFRHTSGNNYHEANEESPNGAEYSILSYIEAKTEDTSINQLVYALRYYGACAQKKFAYGDNLEVGFTNPTVYIYDDQRAANQVETTGTRDDVNGLVKASIQVNFEAGNDLRVAFTLEDGASLSDYTFSLGGSPVEPEQVGKNKYAIIVKNIAAPNLNYKYGFSIADADGNSYTVKASVLSYALIAIDANTNEDTVNLCKALWDYCFKAKAYFGK